MLRERRDETHALAKKFRKKQYRYITSISPEMDCVLPLTIIMEPDS